MLRKLSQMKQINVPNELFRVQARAGGCQQYERCCSAAV
jgi:hypothetical protein